MLCRQEPLRQALEEPKIQVANPTELLRSRSLHAAFRALHAFRREQGHLPQPRAPVGPHPALRGPSSPLPPFPWLASHLCPQADAERVLELAQSLGAQQGPLDDDIVRAFASVSAGDLCPVAAVVGAMAAQEVLKVSGMGVPGSEVPLVTLCSAVQWRLVTTRGHLLPAWGRRAGQQRWAGEHGDPAGLRADRSRLLQAITGKFLPLDQWLYFDALECLALEGTARVTEEDCAPVRARAEPLLGARGAADTRNYAVPLSWQRGSRYDGQIAVFGAAFQEQLGHQKYLVVSWAGCCGAGMGCRAAGQRAGSCSGSALAGGSRCHWLRAAEKLCHDGDGSRAGGQPHHHRHGHRRPLQPPSAAPLPFSRYIGEMPQGTLAVLGAPRGCGVGET